MVRPLAWAIVVVLLVACSAESATPPPAATADMVTAAPPPPTRAPLVPTQAPAPPPDPTAVAAATYRAWMEEARLVHPYSESIETMWAVMICESSGDATVVAGEYHGLFQYSPATWASTWNPYRDQPILDPRAQIFATAKAWQDGYQSWWGCA